MSSNPWQLGYFEKKKNWALNNFSFLSLRISTLLWSKNKSSLISWDCLALQIVESLALVVKKKKKKRPARLKTWKGSLGKS